MNPTLGPAPTVEQLRATYARELPHRPHWPRTFEAAQAHPLISRAIVLLTRTHHIPTPERRASRAPTAAERARAGARVVPPPPPASRAPWHPRPLAPGEVDRRRLAGGDDPSKDDSN